jgi:RHS repeat-associated protein
VRASTGTLPTKRTYTGQIADDTGLYFYNARYYASGLGRFVSADTIVPGAGNPQAFNRYAYSLSNPLKYIDPTGHASRPSCAGIPDCGLDEDDGTPPQVIDPFALTSKGRKMLELLQAAQEYYGAGFDVADLLTLGFSREFLTLNLEWVQTAAGIDPLEFLQHGMTHAAYMNCEGNNGSSPCSSLSTNAILNFLGAYSQSVWEIYKAVVTNGRPFESIVPQKINPVARQVANSIVKPPNPEWTRSRGNIGPHPAYYGNASMYSGVPGGIDDFLEKKGMPVLWRYGRPGEDQAYVLTIDQAKALAPYFSP